MTAFSDDEVCARKPAQVTRLRHHNRLAAFRAHPVEYLTGPSVLLPAWRPIKNGIGVAGDSEQVVGKKRTIVILIIPAKWQKDFILFCTVSMQHDHASLL
jgi:hypothetical protein